MALSRTPAYNLSSVLKETGLSADTLRAWERRYGVPSPQRTPGGHRLYSQWDVSLLKWLRARQAEGMPISRAVIRWKEMTEAEADPLESVSSALVAGYRPAEGSLDALREQWVAACLSYDEAAAEQVLNQAFAQYSVEVVLSALVLRALHEVGEFWSQGQASVQQEHFLSGLAMRRMDALIVASPPAQYPGSILLACAAGELHALPLLYLSLLLRRRGRRAIFLGAEVPAAQLVETARMVGAALVVLSAEQLVTAAALKEAAEQLAKKHIPAAYGGRVFVAQPQMQSRIAARYLGDAVETAPDCIEGLLASWPGIPRLLRSASALDAAAFRDARAGIELNVGQQLLKAAVPGRLLRFANDYFGSELAAALALGDVSYLEPDMAWIRNRLASQGLTERALHDYLLAYSAAVRKVLGASGAALAAWIRNCASRL